MKKRYFFVKAITIWLWWGGSGSYQAMGQSTGSVGIGTNTPNRNAVLELQSSNQGFLTPRLNATQRAALGSVLSPADNGMIVFDSVEKVFYYWKDNSWVTLTFASGGLAGTMWRSGATTPEASLGITGDYYMKDDGSVYRKEINGYVMVGTVKGANPNDAGGKTIIHVASPINAEDAANKNYVDTKSLTGDVSGAVAATRVVRIQGKNVADTTPSEGQVLKWNTATNQWQPGTDNVGTQTIHSIQTAGAITNSGTTTDPVINLPYADGNTTGALRKEDWILFNQKEEKISTGTGLTRTGNTITVEHNSPLWNAGKLQGKTIHTTGLSDGKILKYNAFLDVWQVADDSGAQYQAGTGIAISGSQISTSVDNTSIGTNASQQLEVKNNAITASKLQSSSSVDADRAVSSNHIQNNSITTPKLADGSVTAAKLAQSGATTNQVLKWNGTAWVPSADNSSTYTSGTGITITAGNQIQNTGIVSIGGASGAISLGANSGLSLSGQTLNASAAGDVTGNVGNTTVQGIRGKMLDPAIATLTNTPADQHKVLTWNGTQWVAAAPASATKYHAIDPTSFVGTGKNAGKIFYWGVNADFAATSDKDQTAIGAAVNLPHGATIQRITFYYFDGENAKSDKDMEFLFLRSNRANGISTNLISPLTSSGEPGIDNRSATLSSVVDNLNYSYRIIVKMSDYPNDSDLTKIKHRIYSVIIEYK